MRARMALCLAAVLLAGCVQAPERLTVGAVAPHFELTSLEGPSLDSRKLLGRNIVLNFWATWCLPCLREIPELIRLSEEVDSVEVVGIALDAEGADAVRPFVAKHGIQYTVLLGSEEVFQRFNGLTIPYTLVLDPSHRVVNIYSGPVTRAAIERDLASLIATGPPRDRFPAETARFQPAMSDMEEKT